MSNPPVPLLSGIQPFPLSLSLSLAQRIERNGTERNPFGRFNYSGNSDRMVKMGDGDAAHFRVAAFRRKNSQLRTGSTSLSLSLSLANLATIVKTKFCEAELSRSPPLPATDTINLRHERSAKEHP